MQWTVLELLPRSVFVTLVVVAIVRVVQLSKHHNLDAFPTVGSSRWLGSWWGGIKFMTKAVDIAQEGYRKYKGAPFKIATPSRWIVVVSSRAHIEELRSARDDEFLALEPIFEDLNSEFTLGPKSIHNPLQITVIRSHLTRNLDVIYPAVRDEIMAAFDEILDLKVNEWKSVPALNTMQQIVSRTSNRAFVGLPLCRNADFVALNIEYTISAVIDGATIGLFPNFLRPLASRFITNIPKNTRRGVRHIRPIIEERRKYLKEYGNDWAEKPSDLLSWLMDELGMDATVESLTNCVLLTNFAAIHTLSNVFTNALYNLAAYPQYVRPLREEIEATVEKEGWSKTSLSKMHKLDSFVKETARMDSISALGLTRKAGKDFTFSDGTFIPKGTRVNADLVALHHDDALYESPTIFNPFRFVGVGEEDGGGARYQLVATSPEYLSFGHGRHACPGRHFAAVELKTMLAHVVATYDIKLENAIRPRTLHIGASMIANPRAKVMFRKRTR